MTTPSTPPTDPWAFLTALRLKHEAAAALARKEIEDKKLLRLKPWWLQASQ